MKKFIIPIIVIIDQLIKFLINDILELNCIKNTGGAFGLADNYTVFVIIVSVLFIAIIVKALINLKDEVPNSIQYGLLLVLSGGISNLIDRIFRGYVIDYIDITKFIDYPVFNFADICIVIGAILIIITILATTIQKQENAK